MINANIDILRIITLYQEKIKKIKTITVLIRKKSHPKYQTPNYIYTRLVGPPGGKSLDGVGAGA